MVSAGLDPWMLTKCFVSSKGCSVGSVKSLNIFRLTGRMGRSNLWSTRRRRRRNQLMCRVLVDKTSFLFYFSISIGPVRSSTWYQVPGLGGISSIYGIVNQQVRHDTSHLDQVYLVHSLAQAPGVRTLPSQSEVTVLNFSNVLIFYKRLDQEVLEVKPLDRSWHGDHKTKIYPVPVP